MKKDVKRERCENSRLTGVKVEKDHKAGDLQCDDPAFVVLIPLFAVLWHVDYQTKCKIVRNTVDMYLASSLIFE